MARIYRVPTDSATRFNVVHCTVIKKQFTLYGYVSKAQFYNSYLININDIIHAAMLMFWSRSEGMSVLWWESHGL